MAKKKGFAHKGYTTNYFINFFQSIPRSRWVCGEFGDTQREACALGHAGAYEDVEREDGSYGDGKPTTPGRAKALEKLIPQIIDVNDDATNYGYLGKTPRARVINALKRRQKFGRKWDKNSDNH